MGDLLDRLTFRDHVLLDRVRILAKTKDAVLLVDADFDHPADVEANQAWIPLSLIADPPPDELRDGGFVLLPRWKVDEIGWPPLRT
mgnify:CR=1 FL=1